MSYPLREGELARRVPSMVGVEYTQSLRTKSETEAEIRLGPIRDTLFRLHHGTLAIPAGADPKALHHPLQRPTGS